MTASLDRAVEAAWPEFASSMETDDVRYADPVRKERLRKIIAAAIPHLGVDREVLRTAVADYMFSEGCSCCQDRDAHEKHTETLAKLLNVEPYSDGSGYDFTPYRSKP